MQLRDLLNKTKEIKEAYADAARRKGKKVWRASDYAQGLAGDVGDLLKFILEKNTSDSVNIDKKIRHEVADCLWSIMAIAAELNMDLEKEFLINLEYLKQKLEETK